MSNKAWVVNFKLPNLAASHYWQSVEIDAPDIGMAIKKAWAEVKKRPAVKGRRIKEAQITVNLATGE